MIVFDLKCAASHVVEGWFTDSDDYKNQKARGLLSCPLCGEALDRMPSALAIGRSGGGRDRSETERSEAPRQSDDGPASGAAPSEDSGSSPDGPPREAPSPQERVQTEKPASKPAVPADARALKAALATIARAEAEAVSKSDYVGARFAEEARAMHYGEQPARPIYGETKPKEAHALREEGVPATPLLFPIRRRSDA